MKHFLIYCQGDILLTKEGNIPLGDSCPVETRPWNHVTEITVGGEAYEIIRLDAPYCGDAGYGMHGLRATHGLLADDEYRIAGKGAELVYWDGNTRYCGVCGSPMRWKTDISKQCTGCGKEVWPSPATAIIVRISRGDKILLVHARTFRGNFYGLVAGFVETGESLEQCVEREVYEETRLRIGNIRYYGSQPWPYPNGLMIGFTADYVSGDLCLQQEELSSGGWFGRDNLPVIPDRASIARRLIDDWLSR